MDSPALRKESVTSLVVLDRVHTGVAALHEDLSRRLAAEVLGTKVLELDYVRETMRIEVQHRLPAVTAPLRGATS